MADFAQILIRAIDQSKGAFDSARNNIQGLQSSASKLNSVLASLGVGLSVAGVVAYGKSVIDTADHLKDLSQSTGIAVETLAGLKLAAEQNGTSIDSVAKAIGRLSVAMFNAQQGNKELGALFKSLGVSGNDAEKALFNIADRFSKTKDGALKTAEAIKIFGKNGAEMIPFLNQGGDALRTMAAASGGFADVMRRLAPDADAFNDQLAKLKLNAAGFAGEILSVVVPAMNQFFQEIQNFQFLSGKGMGFFDQFKLNISPLRSAAENLEAVNDAIRKTETNMAKGLKVSVFGFDSPEQYVARLKEVRLELARLANEQRNAAGKPIRPPASLADLALPKAARAVRDPLADLISGTHAEQLKVYADLQDRLNALWEKGRISGTVYAEALTNLRTKFLAPEIGDFLEQQKKVNEELQKDAEFTKAVSDSDQKAFSEMIAAQQEWADAGRQMFLDMETDSEKFADRLAYIDELWRRGVIGIDTYDRATKKAFEDFTPKVEKAKGIMEELGATFESAAENAIVNFKSLRDVFKGLEQDILRIISRAALNDIFGSLFKGTSIPTSGTSFTSLFSNIENFIGGLFGGGKADGGPLMPGKWYIAGEKGPEPIWGGGPGAMAMGYGGGARPVSVVNNFYVAGQPDTRTQMQIANAAGRSVRQAMARNS